MRWKRVTLVGVGLLGGSLGLALRKRRLAASVVGYVRRPASIGECARAGAVEHATCDLLEAVDGADLVVLCTPLGRMRELVQRMLPALRRGVIVTDVGSVKGSVVKQLEPLVARTGATFIGSHPMAGSEKTGVAAAATELFQGAVCVVTPTAQSNPAALRKVEQLWKSVGARLLRLTPEFHDALVSRSSHLPYVLATTLANLVLSPEYPKEQALLCAGGFRDTTRIASGSPEMWRDIALANRANLLKTITRFVSELRGLQRVLQAEEAEAVEAFFTQARTRRAAWLEAALDGKHSKR